MPMFELPYYQFQAIESAIARGVQKGIEAATETERKRLAAIEQNKLQYAAMCQEAAHKIMLSSIERSSFNFKSMVDDNE